MGDYKIYENAARNADRDEDPYNERTLGAAFIYPPQSLLLIELFGNISQQDFKISIFLVANIAMLAVMVYGVINYYKLPLSSTWFFYPLALGFAPFLELLHIGQINIFIMFGMFFAYLFGLQFPLIAGIGLAVVILFKVTPIIFLSYLFVTKNHKTTLVVLGTIVILSVIALMKYGLFPFLTYIDVFQSLLNQFDMSENSQSLAAKLNQYLDVETQARAIQISLGIYLLLIIIISGVISRQTNTLDLFFVTIGLGMAVMPNILWYHHYVFLLIPIFILMCWSRLNPWMTAWCLAGLLLVQVDRWHLTKGLAIHIFTHTTIMAVVLYQITLARNLYIEKKSNYNTGVLS